MRVAQRILPNHRRPKNTLVGCLEMKEWSHRDTSKMKRLWFLDTELVGVQVVANTSFPLSVLPLYQYFDCLSSKLVYDHEIILLLITALDLGVFDDSCAKNYHNQALGKTTAGKTLKIRT